MNTIMITGVGGPAGRASTRFFQENGFEIIGTDIHQVNFDGEQFFEVPRAHDPKFPMEILRIIAREKPKLLIPTVTEELPICSRMKAKLLANGCGIFISEPGTAEIINDKFLTAEKLASKGLASPRTFLSSQVDDAMRAGELLGYPFIVKPRWGRGGKGVGIIQNATQASVEKQRDVVYQEFVAGDEFDANLFVYPAGVVQSAVVLWKSRLKDGIVGNAVEVEKAERKDVMALAIEAACRFGLEGPLDMDIRLNSKGSPTILEINGRVGANSLAAKEIFEAFLKTFSDSSRRCPNDIVFVR